MKERPILFSITTGQPSQRGKRLRSADGLTWKQRNREAVNARRREFNAAQGADALKALAEIKALEMGK